MTDRKYSVKEIDRMRVAIRRLVVVPMRSYYETEVAADIENRLRTYMTNGTEPEELEKAADDTIFAMQQFQSETQKRMFGG